MEKGELLAEINAPGLDAQYKVSLAQLDTAVTNYNLADVTAKRYLESKSHARRVAGSGEVDNEYVAAAAAVPGAQVAARPGNGAALLLP